MSGVASKSPDVKPSPQSLQSALAMDQSRSSQQLPATAPSKKRKKNDNASTDEPSEPRRLRRSHEACARCRSKKIKCDSKYPRCTACATAGTACHQEDRHRQTLTLRGHTEHIEHQLKQCEALLKRHYPGFDLNNLDEVCAREGIHIDSNSPEPPSAAFQFTPSTGRYPSVQPQPPKGFSYVPPSPSLTPYTYTPVYPPPSPQHPPGYNPQIHPSFQPPPQPHPQGPMPPLASVEIKGQDPQSNDMSSDLSLAKSFGVSPEIIEGITTDGPQDNEDLAVGSGGLTSGRDRRIDEASLPRDAARWASVKLPRNRVETSASLSPPQPSVKIWLPKDRQTAKFIINVYFTRLNYHRPALDQLEFERTLEALYDGNITAQHDQGFVCTLYLVLALGTLNEVNHRANKIDSGKAGDNSTPSPIVKQKLMSEGWPEHGEFFAWGLFYKPEIQATISALQALILLHWYLYTERQGRSLWRLVGGLVRLAIELGLHHDPTTQGIFTEEESQLRIRLWGIVIIHDRGTSILLGRPLGIAPYDSNTARPAHPKNGKKLDFSEHFLLSHPIAEIQADIINSLYTPTRQSPDQIMRHSNRIKKTMVEFKRQLPENYQRYFRGSEELPRHKGSQLVQEVSADEGLTLLKFGISRILLLRVLFNSETLPYKEKKKALEDAVITAHNIIVIHNHLICFPDIGFFVSPIPLHIAAMVILFGYMSKLDRLHKEDIIQDIFMALDVLPRMRWRWERKDVNGEHPLIANLAEQVLKINLRDVVSSGHQFLLSEQDLDSGALSPSITTQKQEQMTPVITNVSFPGSPFGHHLGSSRSDGPMPGLKDNSSPGGPQQLVQVPSGLFYPFYPERKLEGGRNGIPQGYHELLAAAGAQAGGAYGPDSYAMDEDTNANYSGMQMWSPQTAQRNSHYSIPPPAQ